jgi:GMP reductase
MANIIDDVKLDFQDVLIIPKRSTTDSRSKVDIIKTYHFRHSPIVYNGIPIIVANMDVTGTFEMAEALKSASMSVALHKFYKEDELIEYFSRPGRSPWTFYTMGISDEEYNKYKLIAAQVQRKVTNPVNMICIDVANGYSRKFVSFVEKVRNEFPEHLIMAGNVVTGDMVYDLLERGADIVKVGIGPGSVCTTRKTTGIGYPQLSAIMECQDAAHGAGGHICGDGGITNGGDLVKAFAGGADFVMCGGLFSGYDECNGERIGDKMKFHGMSSKEAMDKHYGGKAEYRAAEGKEVLVPYKGEVKYLIEDLLGGLRSACTYCGASKLKDLPKCATFVKVNRTHNTIFGE